MRAVRLFVAIHLCASAAAAQSPADVAELMKDGRVTAALNAAWTSEPATIADQIRLCEIPAPPFKEEARARAYAQLFRAAGLRNVRIDAEGNVLGERPGRAPKPHLVLSAHLDTVFPEGTSTRVKRDGRLLRGPGIGDDCRGLAVLLAVARALDAGRVQTTGPITFVGTVGEEGLGDLRGVKALFRQTLKGQVDRFVSIDGTAHEISHVAVGSYRYRVTFRGQGGHSYSDFGIANPMHALGRAMAAIAELQLPPEPKVTFSIGRTGGGTSVNAIATEAWMEIDLRSPDPTALVAVDGRVNRVIQQALADENTRWRQRGRLTVNIERVGERPAGRTPLESPIVQTALAVTKALGLRAEMPEQSTDANVAIALGIPALTVGAGGRVVGPHTVAEAFDTTDSWQGTQRMTLLAIALSR